MAAAAEGFGDGKGECGSGEGFVGDWGLGGGGGEESGAAEEGTCTVATKGGETASEELAPKCRDMLWSCPNCLLITSEDSG